MSAAENACRECGECLVRCRYLGFSRKKAVREMRRVNLGLPSEIFERCAGCAACNAFCPHGAGPYDRILAAWNARNARRGIPARAAYLLPFSRPNFRTDLPFSAEERALHEKWGKGDPPAETVLYPGCNLLAMPLLATGAIFNRLPVWGRFDLCCSEMYWRMGLFGEVRAAAARLTNFYAGKGVREMVFMCPAGANMFQNVLPGRFGARFDFKISHFADWFLAALDRGEFHITRPLSESVVIHDSCHARLLGEPFMERQRELLRRLGTAVYETRQNRAQGLCCGMAAGCARFSARDIAAAALKALRALDDSPASRAVTYCGGCLLSLETVRAAAPAGKPLVHTLELVRTALGENPPHPGPEKGRALLVGIARNALPAYLSRRRLHFG